LRNVEKNNRQALEHIVLRPRGGTTGSKGSPIMITCAIYIALCFTTAPRTLFVENSLYVLLFSFDVILETTQKHVETVFNLKPAISTRSVGCFDNAIPTFL